MHKYLARFDDIDNDFHLANIDLDDSTRFHHIIAGLPEEYCQAMLHISSNSDVQILRSTLRQHSERLIIEKQHKKLEDNTKPLEPTVLYNRQQEPTNLKCKFKNSENSLSSSTKQPSICQYCKNCGHTQDKCISRKNDCKNGLFLPFANAPWRKDALIAI